MGMIQAPNQTMTEHLERLVLQYEKDLLRICCLYLRNWEAAKDAVQETFLKAYKNLASFRGNSSEKTWLIQIALNQCRDMHRSAWHRHIDPRVDVTKLPLASPPPSDDHLSLTIAIMKLKPKYLEAVTLYFYEGYTMKEIASILRISEAAVSQRIQKAKQKLKAELEGGEGNDR